MKVVLLAGGLGTRISEESQFKPKPMIEIGGKPILWHIMKEYSYYGFASSIYDDWFWKIFYEKGSKGNKFSIWISDFDVYEEQRHMGICS